MPIELDDKDDENCNAGPYGKHRFLEDVWELSGLDPEEDHSLLLRWVKTVVMNAKSNMAPIPMRLSCPVCDQLHLDEHVFRTKPHHTHACQHCGHVWRPALVATRGVRFLPGFLNDSDYEDGNEPTRELPP